MLGTIDAMATVAVRDLAVAKKFYEQTLGLKSVAGSMPDAPVYQAGKLRLLVYQSKYAGTNQATAVTWDAGGDIEETVSALKAKGIRFEHYDDLPGLTRKGDLHVAPNFKGAWFKDPDGNIHALGGR
jgi:catechol 2,3-dioxygenase-like lactoylglutathione lyase family enzyme